jgi:hypothetical protein
MIPVHHVPAADDLLTIQESSAYSKISEAGLRSRVAKGTLVAERVGPRGTILIKRLNLDRILFGGGEQR